MKVKMLVCRASADQVDNAGDVIDVDDATGGRMIAAGQAEAVSAPKGRKPSQRAEKRPSGEKRERR